jgi:hypothetical protein
MRENALEIGVLLLPVIDVAETGRVVTCAPSPLEILVFVLSDTHCQCETATA